MSKGVIATIYQGHDIHVRLEPGEARTCTWVFAGSRGSTVHTLPNRIMLAPHTNCCQCWNRGKSSSPKMILVYILLRWSGWYSDIEDQASVGHTLNPLSSYREHLVKWGFESRHGRWKWPPGHHKSRNNPNKRRSAVKTRSPTWTRAILTREAMAWQRDQANKSPLSWGAHQQTWYSDSMLDQCWANVGDGGPTSKQQTTLGRCCVCLDAASVDSISRVIFTTNLLL